MKTELAINVLDVKVAIEKTKIEMNEKFKDTSLYSPKLLDMAFLMLKHHMGDDYYLAVSAIEAVEKGAVA